MYHLLDDHDWSQFVINSIWHWAYWCSNTILIVSAFSLYWFLIHHQAPPLSDLESGQVKLKSSIRHPQGYSIDEKPANGPMDHARWWPRHFDFSLLKWAPVWNWASFYQSRKSCQECHCCCFDPRLHSVHHCAPRWHRLCLYWVFHPAGSRRSLLEKHCEADRSIYFMLLILLLAALLRYHLCRDWQWLIISPEISKQLKFGALQLVPWPFGLAE